MSYRINADTIIVGCDVGKTHHQCHVINADMDRLGRRKIANTNSDVGAMFDWATSLGDEIVLAIDQKASYAAVLRHHAALHQVPVLYVTGLQARRAADLTPGRAKTDRIDAEVIAEFARTHAHRLPVLDLDCETNTDMRLLLGRDEDLRCDFNRIINGLLRSLQVSLRETW